MVRVQKGAPVELSGGVFRVQGEGFANRRFSISDFVRKESQFQAFVAMRFTARMLHYY